MPILLLVFGFEMEEAVVLSNAAVMGNGLAQMAVNFGRRHPYDAKQTLIDWDAVLLLLPAQLGGGNVGVVVGAIFPTTVLLVMSIALLLVASGKTLTKARAQFAKETAAARTRAALSLNDLAPAHLEAPAAATGGISPPRGGVPPAPLRDVVPWTNVAVVGAFVCLFAVDSLLLKGGPVAVGAAKG